MPQLHGFGQLPTVWARDTGEDGAGSRLQVPSCLSSWRVHVHEAALSRLVEWRVQQRLLLQHFLGEGSKIATVDVLGVDSAVTLILREPPDASLEVLRGIARYTGFLERFTQTAKLGVALERGVVA